MKKLYILLLILVGFLGQATAQQAKITANPPSFTALDEVVFTIDVTGTNVANINEPLYLWAWSPGVGDFKTNGSWDNSSESARLVPVPGEANKYTFSLPLEHEGSTYANIAEIIGATPGQVKQLGTLIKTKAGNDAKKTDDLILTLSPLEFQDSFTRTFPGTVTQNDLITIYMTQALAENRDVRYATGEFKIVLQALDAAGELSEEEIHELSRDSEGKYSFTFYPGVTVFPGAADLEGIQYYFVSVADPDVRSENFTLTFVR